MKIRITDTDLLLAALAIFLLTLIVEIAS